MLQHYDHSYNGELTKLYKSIWSNPKYKWYFTTGYPHLPSVLGGNSYTDECFSRVYVSVNKEGCAIGLITYSTNNTGEIATNLGIIGFGNTPMDRLEFAMDLMEAIREFFEVYGGDSIRFTGIPDNPACDNYISIVKKKSGQEKSESSKELSSCGTVNFMIRFIFR